MGQGRDIIIRTALTLQATNIDETKLGVYNNPAHAFTDYVYYVACSRKAKRRRITQDATFFMEIILVLYL